jgi:hypothetical protein
MGVRTTAPTNPPRSSIRLSGAYPQTLVLKSQEPTYSAAYSDADDCCSWSWQKNRAATRAAPRSGDDQARPSAFTGNFLANGRLIKMISERDPADFSYVVKRRGALAKPWRWEIFLAGKSVPVKCSAIFFESMAEASREGKKALADFLGRRAA